MFPEEGNTIHVTIRNQNNRLVWNAAEHKQLSIRPNAQLIVRSIFLFLLYLQADRTLLGEDSCPVQLGA